MCFNTAGARSQLVSDLIERGEQRLEEQGAVTAVLKGQFASCRIVQGHELRHRLTDTPGHRGCWLLWELHFGRCFRLCPLSCLDFKNKTNPKKLHAKTPRLHERVISSFSLISPPGCLLRLIPAMLELGVQPPRSAELGCLRRT